MEVRLVKPVSRLKFVQLLGPYRKGEHLEDPRFKSMIVYRRGSAVEVHEPEGFAASLDGEIVGNAHFSIEMVAGALRFAAPECVKRARQ